MKPAGDPDEIDLVAEKEALIARREADAGDDLVVRAGAEAKRFLDDPVVVGAFAALEVQWIEQFRSSGIDQVAVREEAHRLLNVLGMFKRQLQHEIESGMLATKRKVDRVTEDAIANSEGESAGIF